MVDTIGWPQLTRTVAAQDTALARAGQPPNSIFTGYYGEAGALGVLGGADHLPPVLRSQLLLDVGSWARLRPHRARGGRARPAETVLRELPPADLLLRPVPRAERLDRPADRRLHRPRGQLDRPVAAPQALRLTHVRIRVAGQTAGGSARRGRAERGRTAEALACGCRCTRGLIVGRRKLRGGHAAPRKLRGGHAAPRKLRGGHAAPRKLRGGHAAPRKLRGGHAAPRKLRSGGDGRRRGC